MIIEDIDLTANLEDWFYF